MVNYMTMIVVNIFEAKAKLSEFLDLAARGERVLICKRNRPVAELRAVESARTEPRPIGLARGRLTIPDAFFDPLPDEVLEAFGSSGEMLAELRVAEAPPSKGYGRARKGRGKQGGRQ
jgi:prevent-host-death family protein